MSKIFFITRTYLPVETGIALTRAGMVQHMVDYGFDVTVITPGYKRNDIVENENVIYYPFRFPSFIGLQLERIGVFDDYMDIWVNEVFKYVRNKISKHDIVFSTTGGELGCIKLGYKLQTTVGCRHIIRFHDPISHSYVNGLKNNKMPHVRREHLERTYYQEADMLITSSEYYRDALVKRFPDLNDKIINCYFGYYKGVELKDILPHENLRIAYGGAMAKIQSPETLAKAVAEGEGVEAFFIGNTGKYKPLNAFRSECNFLDSLPHSEYLDFMMQNIDIGFVSLTGDYYGACVPAKLYEYINLGLPMLGALPYGDAMDIINQNGFGIACYYKDMESIRQAVEKMKDIRNLRQMKENIREKREEWSMENRVKLILQNIDKFNVINGNE